MQHRKHVVQSAAALAAAMGIGRFVYTPILPLMTAQTIMTPHTAAALATANYAGYLAGAIAGFVWPRLARSIVACRASLVVLVVSLAGMPLAGTPIEWTLLRTVAGTTMHDPSTHDALAGLNPMGRLGEIDDAVEAVLYLERAEFVTGEILHVDGGQSAGH